MDKKKELNLKVRRLKCSARAWTTTWTSLQTTNSANFLVATNVVKASVPHSILPTNASHFIAKASLATNKKSVGAAYRTHQQPVFPFPAEKAGLYLAILGNLSLSNKTSQPITEILFLHHLPIISQPFWNSPDSISHATRTPVLFYTTPLLEKW